MYTEHKCMFCAEVIWQEMGGLFPTFFSILHRCSECSQETLQCHCFFCLVVVGCLLAVPCLRRRKFSAKTAGRNLENCGGENGSGLASLGLPGPEGLAHSEALG